MTSSQSGSSCNSSSVISLFLLTGITLLAADLPPAKAYSRR